MITITKSGLLTTVQDLGRYGFQKYGVIASGVMDTIAHRLANLLVGNDEYLPTLEITLIGPTIQFHKNVLIAICGGDLSPSINGEDVQSWRSVLVKKGSILKFGPCKKGCRAYLAVAGGFSVPTVMNSKSTYLRARVGGFNGRALQAGDQLLFGQSGKLSMKMQDELSERSLTNFIVGKWSVPSNLIPIFKKDTPIRVIKGRNFHQFTKESQKSFFYEAFFITPQSDRMGYRLSGPLLTLEKEEEMILEAVGFGTIQVPTNGNPIILLADRQPTGVYPKIGQVASVDLTLIAQAKPGEVLLFSEISHREAQFLYLQRERQLQILKHGIIEKFK